MVGGGRFTGIKGVTVYFQWLELVGGNLSPVYSATSDEKGEFHIAVAPYLTANGELIKFDADTTVSAGNERYKLWVDESTIPDGYQLQYITGESILFPRGGVPITQGGSSSSTARNTHNNWKVLLMEKPKDSIMHKAEAYEASQMETRTEGYISGNISWDYKSDAGGVQWNKIADRSSPVEGVRVKASYLSDYAMKQIYTPKVASMLDVLSPKDIRGRGWTPQKEKALQDWIRGEVEKDPDNWIAETVTGVTDKNGNYKLPFKGTWGPARNAAVATYKTPAVKGGWTKEAVDRIGTVSKLPTDGRIMTSAADYNEKHINFDWIYVSTEDTENLRILTPYNNNGYNAMNSNWGIHAGWSSTDYGVGISNAIYSRLRADFRFAPEEIVFEITNHNDTNMIAEPGDVAQTKTTGLPVNFANDKFQIVWFDENNKEVKTGAIQTPTGAGVIESEPFDTSEVTETTRYRAELYRMDGRNRGELIAVDSFTVVVENIIGSMYEEYTAKEPLYKLKKPTSGVTYSAMGLPNGLTMSENGVITGKATEAGLFDVTVVSSFDDGDAGIIVATSKKQVLITDTPFELGFVGIPYKNNGSNDIKPVEAEGYKFEIIGTVFEGGTAPDGLAISEDFKTITGTPTAVAAANQENPNVKVTYKVSKLNSRNEYDLIEEAHVDRVPLEVITAVHRVKYPEEAIGDPLKPATINAPQFSQFDKATGELTPLDQKPDGATFALAEGAPEGAEIDPNTGVITYTPTEDDAGKTLEIPVIVTYPNSEEKDTTTATLKVGELEDVIDRSTDPTHKTPEGYVRVSFKAGEGIEPLTDTKVYDVKIGAALTADQYPGYTLKEDTHENPSWSLEPGTLLVQNLEVEVSATPIPQSELNDAAYPESFVRLRDPVKVLPQFTGKDGKPSTPGVKSYAIPADFERPASTTISVNAATGEVTFTTTNLDLIGATISVPVVVTYSDHVYSEKEGQMDNNFISQDYIYADITVIEMAEDIDASYPITKSEAGKSVTTVVPSFVDSSGKTIAGPVKSYETADGAPTGATVGLAGRVTYRVPADATENIFIPILITYTDGSTDLVDAIIQIKPFIAENLDPQATDISVDLNAVLGDAEAEQAIRDANPDIQFPDGTSFEFKDIVNTLTAGTKAETVIITYPDGSTDEVTVNVTVNPPAEADAAKYDAVYPEDTSGTAGEEITIGAPIFEDNAGQTVDKPEGTKFVAIAGETPDGVSIDPETGEIRYTLPGNAKETLEIPVGIVYPDGSKETAYAKVTVEGDNTAPNQPASAEAMYGDDKIKVSLPQNSADGAAEDYVAGDIVYITKSEEGKDPVIIGQYTLTADDIAKLKDNPLTVNVPINGTELIVGKDAATKPSYAAYTQDIAGNKSNFVDVSLIEDEVAPNPPEVDKAEGDFGANEVIVSLPQNSDNRADTDLRIGDKVLITLPVASEDEVPQVIGEYELEQKDIDKIAIGELDVTVTLTDDYKLNKDITFDARTQDKTGNMSDPEKVVVYPAAPELEVGGETATVKAPEYGDKITISIPGRDDVVAIKGEDGAWTVDGQPVTEENGQLIIPLAEFENRIPARETVTATVTDTANDLSSKQAEAIVKDTTAPLAPTSARGVDGENKLKLVLPKHTGEDTDILDGDKVVITIPGENGAEDQVIGEYTLTLDDYYKLVKGDLEVEVTLNDEIKLDKNKTYKANTVDELGNASETVDVEVTDAPVAPDKAVVDDITAGDEKVVVSLPENGDKISITIPGEDGAEDYTVEASKDTEGNWKVGDQTIIPTEDGKLEIPVEAEKLTEGTKVRVTVTDTENGLTSEPVEKEVAKAPDTIAPNAPIKAEGISGDNKLTVSLAKNTNTDKDLQVGDKLVVTVPGASPEAEPVTIGEYVLTAEDVEKINAGETTVEVPLNDNKTLDKDGTYNVVTEDKAGNKSDAKLVELRDATTVTGEAKDVKADGTEQETGLTVNNKKDTTSLSAKDAKGNDVQVRIDEDGKVLVIPQTGAEGPITLTVKDDDFVSDENTEGTKEFTVEVTKYADELTPAYKEVETVAGQDAVASPAFKDKEGQATTAPTGTKFALADNAPEGAIVDEETGEVSFPVPEEGLAEDVKIPVKVTYPDGSTDEVEVTIKATTDLPTKPKAAIVEDVTAGDEKITVTEPKDGDKISITIPGGDGAEDYTVEASKDAEGNWKVGDQTIIPTEDGKLEIPVEAEKLTEGTKVSVTVTDTENGLTSEPVEKEVAKAPVAPSKPVVDDIKVGDTSLAVEVPENGDKITVTLADNNSLEVIKDENGNWLLDGEILGISDGKLFIPVGRAFAEGDTVKVVVSNGDQTSEPTDKEVEESAKATVTDLTAKNAEDATIVTGKTTPNTKVSILGKKGEPVVVTSDENGNFTARLPLQDEGSKITARPENGEAGNATVETEAKIPEKAVVDKILAGDNSLAVKTPADGDKITVKLADGTLVEAVKNADGNWTVAGKKVTEIGGKLIIPLGKELAEGEKVEVTVSSGDLTSNPTEKVVEKKVTEPESPTDPEKPTEPSKPEKPQKPGKPGQESPKTDRTSGMDRIETAIAISQKYFDKANTVIIVDSGNFPDAMTASVLAKLLDAPILLTGTNKLDKRVEAEIQRLGVKDVIIVGGASSVSEEVKAELAKFDHNTVERIYGENRYETSAAVARRVVEINGKTGHAVIASGEVFADALAVGPYAAREGYPILLVSKNHIPTLVAEAIKDLEITSVTIAGGVNTVSKELEKDLPKVVERLAGDTRYETAIAIAESKFAGSKEIFLANGDHWMDALVIGPVGGKLDMPILLTGAKNAPKSLKDFANKAKIEQITAIGGKNMISDKVLEELSK